MPVGTRNSRESKAGFHLILERWILSYKNKLLSQKLVQQNETNSNRSVVMLSFGSWDVAFRSLNYFAKYTTVVLKQFFATISNDPILSHLKFFVLTPPSCRERTERHKPLSEKTDLRSNPRIAATVFMISEIVKPYSNIALLDYYAISISRSTDVVDAADHYLTPLVKGNNSAMVGHVGITTANLLLEKIC